MTDAAITVAGRRALSAHATFPGSGAWIVDLNVDFADLPSGRVQVKIGSLTLSGTVDPAHTGTHLHSGRVRVVGGAGAWSARVPERGYHNDAGVSRALVAADLAAELGEEFAAGENLEGDLGIDFVRAADTASNVLRSLFGSWWVGPDGMSHVGAHPAAEVGASYQVLDFEPRNGTAVIATERPDTIIPGAVLRLGRGAPLDLPLVAWDVTITADARASRVYVWGGAVDRPQPSENRLLAALGGAFALAVPRWPFAFLYRYRVIEMQVDRAALQIVRLAAGVPDVLPVAIWAGMAGLSADLAPGAEVIVGFIDGETPQPIILAHCPKDHPGHVPPTVRLDGSTAVMLGAALAPVIRVGDTVAIAGAGPAAGVISVTLGLGVPPLPSRVKA